MRLADALKVNFFDTNLSAEAELEVFDVTELKDALERVIKKFSNAERKKANDATATDALAKAKVFVSNM